MQEQTSPHQPLSIWPTPTFAQNGFLGQGAQSERRRERHDQPPALLPHAGVLEHRHAVVRQARPAATTYQDYRMRMILIILS